MLNERAINTENGFSAEHDDLPPRFFQESGSGDATLHIPPLDRSAFLSARDNYYQVRGCDSHGIPTVEACTDLGIEPPYPDSS
ncbi:MAG: hypothetical protein D6E12_01925 [Desulfovibrio sp.]|nr:MAG: hypothetical protein D6E12_01925 [Desulfovibrio sp.]